MFMKVSLVALSCLCEISQCVCVCVCVCLPLYDMEMVNTPGPVHCNV